MLSQYTDVRLMTDYSRNGLALPVGTIGTILDIYPQYDSYMIEFDGHVEMVPMKMVSAI